jgi:hypothetical protein
MNAIYIYNYILLYIIIYPNDLLQLIVTIPQCFKSSDSYNEWSLQILPYLSAIHCSQLYGFVYVAVKLGGWIEIASTKTPEGLCFSRPLRGLGMGPEFHELDRIGNSYEGLVNLVETD